MVSNTPPTSKRKAEYDVPPLNTTRNVRPRSEQDSNPVTPVLPDQSKYQFKVLANIPPAIPFFTETAQSIFDEYALKTKVTQPVINMLLKALQDENASQEQVMAARVIWRNNLLSHKAKELGMLLGSIEMLKEALYFLIAGARENGTSGVSAALHRGLNEAISQCFVDMENGVQAGKQPATDLPVIGSKPTDLSSGTSGPRAPTTTQGPGKLTPEQLPTEMDTNSTPNRVVAQTRANGTLKQGLADTSNAKPVDSEAIDELIAEGARAAHVQPSAADQPTSHGAQQSTVQDQGDDITALLEASLTDPENNSTRAQELRKTPPAETSTSSLSIRGGATPVDRPSDHDYYRGQGDREDRSRREGKVIHHYVDRGYDSYKPGGGGFTNSRPRLPDGPLSDRITPRDEPTVAELMAHPSRLTCFFWFTRGLCDKGNYCKFSHAMQDYVASYSPMKGRSTVLRIIRMPTIEETRSATLAHDPNYPGGRSWEYDGAKKDRLVLPKTKPDLSFSDTPIVDVLLDKHLSLSTDSSREVISNILYNIRARRDRSQRDFVTEIYDHKNKLSNFNLEHASGMKSKLGGAMAQVSDNPEHSRKLLEDMLRPFVTANKGKFLDLPERAFKTPAADGEYESTPTPDRARNASGLYRNMSKTFNAPK